MNKLRQLDHRLVTILLIVFVQMVGAAMILPILPIYARREFDMPVEVITLLNSAFFAAQFVAGPYLGRWSDRFGRVPILIVSQIGTAISFLMIALAPGAGLLFAARILDGITGGNIIVAQAYITDITPKQKRTEALGYIQAVFGLGFIIGPALGGVMAAAFGPRLPYIFAAVAAFLTVLLTWISLDETLSPEQRSANRAASERSGRVRQIISGNHVLVLILSIAFVGQFAFGLLQSTFSLYGEEVIFANFSAETALRLIGLLLATVGLTQFLTQVFFLRRLLARFSEAWLIIAGNLLRGLGMFMFALLATPIFGIASSAVFAVGMAITMPSLQSLTTSTVSDELRGSVLGIYQSVISLSIIVSTAIAGVLYAIRPNVPFWIGGALSLLATLPAVALLGHGNNRDEPTLSRQ
ncbi:MAG: MFS transporter [Anaerolineae bacterium]|nr:MFS transporter [Anaerolineae bacterium]